ncbi:hypothetical protein HHO41_03755 [Bacillus sp. DNRA2]|uniref:hypothetical protein n=1 Tax=Bacillus sp. DNRA2 TaxID=2723053 RepID=UPI00145E40D6|nr:hypothetical protein [Bacillus sp. DNRA2]NMD69391.1 hypothetical protein [Bacillus sp. DNRA2]
MEHLYGWLIAFGILGLQHFLSRRKSVYWGALLPVAFLIFLVVMFVKNWHGGIVGIIIPSIILLLILCVNWATGREDLKKKRKKELEKILVNDL